MTHACRRWIAVPMLVALGIAGCGAKDSTDPVPVDPNVTVSGLKFSLSGAVLTSVSASLPTPEAAFTAPIVTINRAPTSTQPATISVSAAEPFTAVLIQPTGSASYARVALPAQTTLIGVSALTDLTSSFLATSVTVSVVSGTRTSKTTAVSFQTVGN